MSIPDSVIEEVRLRGDLVELVSEHTRLKRSGKTFRGPCPLHGGEGPNFSVDPQKNVFKCFVCQESGDIFSFPMKHLGMDFLEAVRFVAERAGVVIPEARERRPEEDPHRRYHEVNDFAAEWFRKQLRDEEEGRKAREYLRQRGISREAAERFGLGWAPEEWTAFGDVARKQGIGNDLLLALGLVKEAKRSGAEPYDAFRGRLVFPIEDLGGRVVAFGGRILGRAEEHVPKYLNSPETPVYRKGDVLYGLGWSRGAIRRAESVLVVEGYMDYVSLAAHGVENAVAPLGTAMTEEQADLVSRYAPRAILLYDSDKAGLRATFRTGDALLRAGVEVLVATLPEREDPDSLVRAKGAAALRAVLDDAVDVMERKIQLLERKGYFTSITGTRRAIDALLPTVRAASDEVLRGVYLRRISDKTGVPRETLAKEIAAATNREAQALRSRSWRTEHGQGSILHPDHSLSTRLGAEWYVLLGLFDSESRVEATLSKFGPEDFQNRIFQRVFQAITEFHGERDPAGEWVGIFDSDLHQTVEAAREDLRKMDPKVLDDFFNASVQRINVRPLERRFDELPKRFDSATDTDIEKLKEFNDLLYIKRTQKPDVRSRFLKPDT